MSDADSEARMLLGVIVFLTSLVLVLALPWWVALPAAFLVASVVGRIARSIE